MFFWFLYSTSVFPAGNPDAEGRGVSGRKYTSGIQKPEKHIMWFCIYYIPYNILFYQIIAKQNVTSIDPSILNNGDVLICIII